MQVHSISHKASHFVPVVPMSVIEKEGLGVPSFLRQHHRVQPVGLREPLSPPLSLPPLISLCACTHTDTHTQLPIWFKLLEAVAKLGHSGFPLPLGSKVVMTLLKNEESLIHSVIHFRKNVAPKNHESPAHPGCCPLNLCWVEAPGCERTG